MEDYGRPIKNLSRFEGIFLAVWTILCLGITWMTRNVPPDKPVIISMRDAHTCEKVGGEWRNTSVFRVGQDINICGRIHIVNSDQPEQIQIRVFEGEQTFFNHQFYDHNITVANHDERILIILYMFPGNYEIQLLHGRKAIGSFDIQVVDP